MLDRETYEMVAEGLILLGLVRPHRALNMSMDEALSYCDKCWEKAETLTNELEVEVAKKWSRGWYAIACKIAESEVLSKRVRRPNTSMDLETCKAQVYLINELLDTWAMEEHAKVLLAWRRGHQYNIRQMEEALSATTDGRGAKAKGRSAQKAAKAAASREQRNQLKGKKVSAPNKY